MRRFVLVLLFSSVLMPAFRLAAQESPPPPAPTPAVTAAAAPEKDEAIPYRPIEGPVIINLPSVDVPRKGTLTVLFAHRFQTAVQGSSIDNLFSFDDAANIGIGLGYAPVEKFALYFYRYSNFNKTYEVSGKYSLLACGPFAISLGAGGDFRTLPDPESPPPPAPQAAPITNRSTFFAQAILAYTPFPWLRITAEPMYLNHTSGQPAYAVGTIPDPAYSVVRPEPFYANVVNVPVAVSVALTHSITVHGEVVPSYSRTDGVTRFDCGPADHPFAACPTVSEKISPGVGWIVSVEKTLLRHRFAFTAGNMRETTVDQYLLPSAGGFPKNVYLGFYLSRQWPLIR
jgi:hypothetical protein